MSKYISYALFGFDKERVNGCFDFSSYLRGLTLCLRFNKMLYPEWQTILNTDISTYQAFPDFFKILQDRNLLVIEQNPNNVPLCEAMLWRMKPIYTQTATHVLCRDLDSPATYREVQAVQMWLNKGTKAMHAITDSVSHDVPLLGGMIGISVDAFKSRTGTNNWGDFRNMCRLDLSGKGSDQTFLNSKIYPLVAEKGSDSITQHYFKGHGKTWLSDFHTCSCWLEQPALGHKQGCPLDVALGIPIELKETDECCQHIGSAGYNEPATMRWVNKHKAKFEDIITAELLYPKIFYWNV